MRPDQERVRNLLTDTVTLLCKNGLQFNKQLKVQGLLGITTDENDVFVVHINENFGEAIGSASITLHQPDSPEHSESGVVDLTERDRIRRKPHHASRRKRRSRDSDSSPRLGSPSHVPPSPTISNSETESAHFRIKKEENSASGGCRGKDRSRKLYPSSGDDRDAMRETYSGLSLSDIQSGFEFEAIAGGGLEGTNGSTGPPSKRRTLPPVAASTSRPPDHADSPSAGPFITGIARHSEKTGSSSDTVANVSSWDNSALDELSQMTGDGSLDDTPGCSSWGPSQTAGEVPGLPQGPDDSVGILSASM